MEEPATKEPPQELSLDNAMQQLRDLVEKRNKIDNAIQAHKKAIKKMVGRL